MVGEQPSAEPQWADRRLSFGSAASRYDQFRPTYPDEAVRWCLGPIGVRVIDVGSGTGRLAQIAQRLGYDVLAVEPDDGMRAVAEKALPGRTAAGSAEAIPVEDRSADAVTAAQAYHWFDPGRAHKEFARVLRPGGRFAALWNFRDDRVAWVRDLYGLIGGEDHLAAAEKVEPPSLGEGFGPVEVETWTHRQRLSIDDFLGLVGSYSYVALRSDASDVLEAVRDLAAHHPDLCGRSILEVPYVTKAVRAARLP